MSSNNIAKIRQYPSNNQLILNKIKIKTKSNNNWHVRKSFQLLVHNANNNIISFSNWLEAQAVYWILYFYFTAPGNMHRISTQYGSYTTVSYHMVYWDSHVRLWSQYFQFIIVMRPYQIFWSQGLQIFLKGAKKYTNKKYIYLL